MRVQIQMLQGSGRFRDRKCLSGPEESRLHEVCPEQKVSDLLSSFSVGFQSWMEVQAVFFQKHGAAFVSVQAEKKC